MILDYIRECARGDAQLIAATVSTLTACGVALHGPLPCGRRGAVLQEEIQRVCAYHCTTRHMEALLEVEQTLQACATMLTATVHLLRTRTGGR